MTDRIEEMADELERRAATENISFAVLLEDSAQALREMREALHSIIYDYKHTKDGTFGDRSKQYAETDRRALQGVDHD